VLNGRGGVATKNAWEQWNLIKNVLNLTNIESRNSGGLAKRTDTVRLHSASYAQAKALKGAEKSV
jgi:hypothetical protein